jgi:hypothetical protein
MPLYMVLGINKPRPAQAGFFFTRAETAAAEAAGIEAESPGRIPADQHLAESQRSDDATPAARLRFQRRNVRNVRATALPRGRPLFLFPSRHSPFNPAALMRTLTQVLRPRFNFLKTPKTAASDEERSRKTGVILQTSFDPHVRNAAKMAPNLARGNVVIVVVGIGKRNCGHG